jgi:hypothetical protein
MECVSVFICTFAGRIFLKPRRMKRTINSLPAATIIVAAMLCLSCGNSSTPANSDDTEEQKTEYTDNEPTAYEEEPDENEGEVWTSIGGTYPYSCGDTSIIVTSLGRENSVNIDGEDYEATIDAETGRINAVDANGKLVFSGFMYNGAAVLKGNLRGDTIRLEGMFGL